MNYKDFERAALNLFNRKNMIKKHGKSKFESFEKEVQNNFKNFLFSCEGIKLFYTKDKKFCTILTYEDYDQVKPVLQLDPPVYLPYYLIKEIVKSSENIPEGSQIEEILFNGYPTCSHQFEEKSYNYIASKSEFSRHPWFCVGRIPIKDINDLKFILLKLTEQFNYLEVLKSCFPMSNLVLPSGDFDGTTIEVGTNFNTIFLNLFSKQIEIKIENQKFQVTIDEKLNQNASTFLDLTQNIPVLVHMILKKK